jgi:hypothetical protein
MNGTIWMFHFYMNAPTKAEKVTPGAAGNTKPSRPTWGCTSLRRQFTPVVCWSDAMPQEVWMPKNRR